MIIILILIIIFAFAAVLGQMDTQTTFTGGKDSARVGLPDVRSFRNKKTDCLRREGVGDIQGKIIIPLSCLTGRQITELAKILGDPESMKHIGLGSAWNARRIHELVDYDRQDAETPAKARKYFSWALVNSLSPESRAKSPGQIAGYLSLRPFESGLQFRYVVSPQFRGHGIAAAAIREVMTLLQDAGNPATFSAIIAKDNIASRKTIERAGFSLAGETNISGVLYDIFRAGK